MTVAMSKMIRSDTTRKIVLKVTMSIMTTMTTVLHRDFESGQVLCLQGVLFGLHGRVLISVVTPFFQEWPRNSSFPTQLFKIMSCRSAYILVHACVFDIAQESN